jgi:hypothetical protein
VRRTIVTKLLAAVLLAAFVGLIALDLLQVFRPSGVAALACTTQLFSGPVRSGQADADALVLEYRDAVSEQAGQNDLPPELVAAVIVNHQAHMSSFRRFTDCFGSALGANLSLGLAQLRLGTAALLDGTMLDALSPGEFRRLRAALLEPDSNIAYEARELRALLEREHRYPGMSAAELIHEPFVMALAISEYRSGRRATASEDSRLNAEAFNALRLIKDDTLYRFGRDRGDVERIQASIGEYLDSVYCDSGIFNAGVCEAWRRDRNAGTRDTQGL